MRVLSLFDGISCARLALEGLGIAVEQYFASEINEKSMAVTQAKWPDTVQVGDVSKLRGSDLPRIDFLIGGSPCTNLSIAGDRSGLQGDESKLFYEYLRLREECRPKHWLLENVWSMSAGARAEMDRLLGVESRLLNSSVWTAQCRKRVYWTDLPAAPEPAGLGLVVSDILQVGEVPESLRLKTHQEVHPSEKMASGQWLDRDRMVKAFDIGRGRQGERIYSIHGKSTTLTAGGGGPGSKTGVYYVGDYVNIPSDQESIKSSCRRLTPVEAERLQGVPDNHTAAGGATSTERYRMLGNGFTVPTIMFLIEHLAVENGGLQEAYAAASRGK